MEDGRTVNLGGRPPHEPTEQSRLVVKKSAAIGVSQEEIAKRLRICTDTLRKHYQDELFDGVYEANYDVGGMLFELSTKDPDSNVRLKGCVYWTSRRMGWKEAGKDEVPVTRLEVEFKGGLPDRELKQVEAEGEGDENV